MLDSAAGKQAFRPGSGRLWRPALPFAPHFHLIARNMPEIAGKYAYGGPLASRGLAGWGNLLWVFPSGLCHAVGETPQSDDHLAFLNVPPDQRRAVNIEREHTEWEPLRRASLPPVGICPTVAFPQVGALDVHRPPAQLELAFRPIGIGDRVVDQTARTAQQVKG